MHRIPVTFKSSGKIYHGHLTPVTGVGQESTHFHLDIGGYYRGQLFQVPDVATDGRPLDLSKPAPTKWRFASQKGEFEELADYFGDVVVAWYQ